MQDTEKREFAWGEGERVESSHESNKSNEGAESSPSQSHERAESAPNSIISFFSASYRKQLESQSTQKGIDNLSEEDLMQFITAIFSLAKSFKFWEVGKMCRLVSLGLKLKKKLSGLNSLSNDGKLERALDCIEIVGTYRAKNKDEFDGLLDSLYEVASSKKAEALKIAKKFLD